MRACAKCKIDGEKATRYYSGGMEGRKEKKKIRAYRIQFRR